MDRFGTLRLFAAVSLLSGVCHCFGVVYVQGPVKAIMGSCVLVPCSTDPYSNVKWYKYKNMGYPVVYSRDSSEIMDEFRGRTSVPGSAQDGNCTLRIDNVKQEDSRVALYVWIWKYGEDKGFYDRTININVLDPVTPQMSVTRTQTEGRDFTATCNCHHSCPASPPQMAWLGLSPISNVLKHKSVGEGLWVTEATATFRATRQQNQNTVLSCKCVLIGRTLSSDSVSLDVLHAPMQVKIDYTGSSTVVEGNNISLACNSKSRPEPTDYEWLVTTFKTTVRHKGHTVVLQDVRRHTSVSCVVTNSIGRGESEKLSLNVSYAPTDVKVDYAGSSTVVEGNEISLECTSESSPVPTKYEWVITQNGSTIHKEGRTVVLQDVMRDTSASCMASNSLGRGQSKPISLSVHYSPSILPSSFCSMVNEKLQCSCQVEAYPSPVISWTVDGSDALFPLFTTTSQNNGNVMVSELTGPPGHNVTCTATNSVGTRFTQIPFHSEGNASIVMPYVVAAVVVAVLIVLGLAVTLIMIRKKRGHTQLCKEPCPAQQVSRDKVSHDYTIEPDEDLYVNAMHLQRTNKDQDADSCDYENFY